MLTAASLDLGLARFAAIGLVVDAIAIVISGALAAWLYFYFVYQEPAPVFTFLRLGVLAAAIYCGIAQSGLGRASSTYRALTGVPQADGVREGLAAWIIVCLVFVLASVSVHIGQPLSRGAVLLFFVLGALAIVASRLGVPAFIVACYRAGHIRGRSVFVVGASGSSALSRLASETRDDPLSTTTVMPIDADMVPEGWAATRRAIIERMVRSTGMIDSGLVLVATGGLPAGRVEELLLDLRHLPVGVYVVEESRMPAGVQALAGNSRVEFRAFAVQRPPVDALQVSAKRVFDVLTAGLAIAALSPVLLAIAAAIRLETPGPVIFRQRRTGLNGRSFRIWKFRTMTVLEDGSSVVQARRDDQRVTRVGRWLRSSSLDELPQLFNVLTGDMSLVGPRPHALAHDTAYGNEIERYVLRQAVRPGITGWAQVNGLRGETAQSGEMRRRVEFDCWYITNQSLRLDLMILLRTPFEVLARRSKAY